MTQTLPPDWRQLGIYALRDLARQLPEPPSYLQYMRKRRLIEWIEKHGHES